MELSMESVKKDLKKRFSSKVSIVGLFAVLTMIITVPALVLVSQNNQDPRSRASEITPSPTKTQSTQSMGFISGYVYLDTNRNGQREGGEKPYPNAVIKISGSNGNGVIDTDAPAEIKTDALGYFKFTFPKNNKQHYIIKLDLPAGYKTINTNPVLLSDIQTKAQDVLQFGIFPLKAVVVPPSPKLTPGLTPQSFAPSGVPQVCLQVLTPARNTATGECNTFSNSCLPNGWIKDASCQENQSNKNTSPGTPRGNANGQAN
jgi:hypothetical protein